MINRKNGKNVSGSLNTKCPHRLIFKYCPLPVGGTVSEYGRNH